MAKNVDLDKKPSRATLEDISANLQVDEEETSPKRTRLVFSDAHFKRKSTFLESYNERLQASRQSRLSLDKAKRDSVQIQGRDEDSSLVKVNQSISRRTDYTNNRIADSYRGMKFLSQVTFIKIHHVLQYSPREIHSMFLY